MKKTGERAPDFRLADVNGDAHTLAGLLGGGPVLLAFFKVSCPVCQYTLPFLERLWQERRVNVFGVSQNDREATLGFAERYGLTYPMLLDDLETFPASNAYGLTNVPTMFLVEQDGSIGWASTGFHKAELEQLAGRFRAGIFRPDERVPEWKPG